GSFAVDIGEYGRYLGHPARIRIRRVEPRLVGTTACLSNRGGEVIDARNAAVPRRTRSKNAGSSSSSSGSVIDGYPTGHER
ncbi:MAG TPA: hypothetical protein VFC00_39940, partial [Micromonosporaceae bacterium]|nr:hypothetical protein [Micromonosporaceae bacterium]